MSETPSSPVDQGPNRTRRKVLKGILTIGAAVATGEGLARLIIAATEEKPSPRSPCYNPTGQELTKVKAIINLPREPISKYISPAEREREDIRRKSEVAKRYGLTMYDYQPIYDPLMLDVDPNTVGQEPQHKFDTYFITAQAFLERYGVELLLQKENGKYKEGEHPLTAEEKESVYAKHLMVELIRSFGNLPVELIRNGGLKKVVLINTGSGNGGYAPEANSDTYYADLTDGPESVFNHEFYHQYEYNHYGPDVWSDSGFVACNPEQEIYGKSPKSKQYISLDTYKQFVSEHSAEYYSADETEKQSLQRLFDEKAALVAVVSDYSFTNAVEDKAEIGRTLLDTATFYTLFDPRTPILRDKALFLLGRLYHDEPRIVQYLADVSYQAPHA